MAKFIETCMGNFINFDAVKLIQHEDSYWDLEAKKVRYYSYLYDRSGEEHVFLDFVEEFQDQKKNMIKFDCDHAISLHRHAIQIILDFPDNSVITYEFIEDLSWKKFIEEYNEKMNEIS